MTDHEIAVDVRRLLRDYVETYEQLDILRLFASAGGAALTPDAAAAAAGLRPGGGHRGALAMANQSAAESRDHFHLPLRRVCMASTYPAAGMIAPRVYAHFLATWRGARAGRRPRASLPAWSRSSGWWTPASGRAFDTRRATRRRSRWPSLHAKRRLSRWSSSDRFRSTRPRWRRWRPPSSAPASISVSGRMGTASCACGAQAGTTPALCLVLEVAGPGLLVIKHHRGEDTSKFANVAVLEGDRVRASSTSTRRACRIVRRCSARWWDSSLRPRG